MFSNVRRVLSERNTRLRLLYLLIILKFQYNARSHWFEQRAFVTVQGTESKRKLTPASAEMADKFPNFF